MQTITTLDQTPFAYLAGEDLDGHAPAVKSPNMYHFQSQTVLPKQRLAIKTGK